MGYPDFHGNYKSQEPSEGVQEVGAGSAPPASANFSFGGPQAAFVRAAEAPTTPSEEVRELSQVEKVSMLLDELACTDSLKERIIYVLEYLGLDPEEAYLMTALPNETAEKAFEECERMRQDSESFNMRDVVEQYEWAQLISKLAQKIR